jgi:GNAT superfamily N-acetyltransferase
MAAQNLHLKHAVTDDEILLCWQPVYALRPHLEKENYLPQTREMMREGYQMIYIEEDGKAIAFSGFRNMNMFYSGKIIYIDDLGTLTEHRGRGCGTMLLNYIHELARAEGKTAVHLDSGHHRFTAHRLYLNEGYNIIAHHFVHDLK